MSAIININNTRIKSTGYKHNKCGICCPWSRSSECCDGEAGATSDSRRLSLNLRRKFPLSSEASGGDSEMWFGAFSASTRDFLQSLVRISGVYRKIENALSPLALRHHTFDLIQAAIRTRRAIFHDVTANLASSTATASFRSTSLDRTGVDIEASRRGLAFPLSLGGIHWGLGDGGSGRGGGVSHDGEW